MKKEKIFEVKEEVRIGNVMLEPGDKFVVLKENKKITEEMIEIMRDRKGHDITDLVNMIEEAYEIWLKATKDNYDEDTLMDEWGYRDYSEIAEKAAYEIKELVANAILRVRKKYRV